MRASDMDALGLARRLDWRFLLPDPRLEQVAYIGPLRGELRRALHRFTRSVVENPDAASSAEHFELVVVAAGYASMVSRAAALLKPGGHVYWEVDRSGSLTGPDGILRDPRKKALALDLTDVRAHWHYPNLESTRMILPPTAPAVAYAHGRRAGSSSGIARALLRGAPWGLLPRIVPGLSIIARRPGGGDSQPLLGTAGLDGIDEAKAEDGHYVLLTPRFRASRHVITLFLEAETGEAVSVAKTARIPGNRTSLSREAEALEAAATVLPDPRSVPRLRALAFCGGSGPRTEASEGGEGAFGEHDYASLGTARARPQRRASDITGDPGPSRRTGTSASGAPRAKREKSDESQLSRGTAISNRSAAGPDGHLTLVASAVSGRLLTPADFLDDAERLTGAVSTWLTTLHRATRIETTEHVRTEWVEAPLRRIQEEVDLGREGLALLERTRALSRPLVVSDVPTVLEHGDVSCPNILLSKTGRIGVVDWERAALAGVPASDLFFLLAFVAVSRERADGTEQAVVAFQDAFRGKDAWAVGHIARYWREMDLPVSAAAPLFVVSWARRAAEPSGLRERYLRFWREACAWAPDLEQKLLDLS